MCDNSDTCAEIELNNFVLGFLKHPCAITPIYAKTPDMSDNPHSYGIPLWRKGRQILVFMHQWVLPFRRKRFHNMLERHGGTAASTRYVLKIAAKAGWIPVNLFSSLH